MLYTYFQVLDDLLCLLHALIRVFTAYRLIIKVIFIISVIWFLLGGQLLLIVAAVWVPHAEPNLSCLFCEFGRFGTTGSLWCGCPFTPLTILTLHACTTYRLRAFLLICLPGNLRSAVIFL